MGPGPYLVIPILGPSSSRDLLGKVGDFMIDPVGLYLIREDKEDILFGTKIIQAIDTRSELDAIIEGSRKSSLDPYAIIRTMYLQRRARQIANEDVEIFFGTNVLEETSIFDIEINDQRIININNKKFCFFTNIEKEIFQELINKKTAKRKYLEENILKINYKVETRSLDSHLSRIRKKLQTIYSKIKIISRSENVIMHD